jgi:hypothetical protein
MTIHDKVHAFDALRDRFRSLKAELADTDNDLRSLAAEIVELVRDTPAEIVSLAEVRAARGR